MLVSLTLSTLVIGKCGENLHCVHRLLRDVLSSLWSAPSYIRNIRVPIECNCCMMAQQSMAYEFWAGPAFRGTTNKMLFKSLLQDEKAAIKAAKKAKADAKAAAAKQKAAVAAAEPESAKKKDAKSKKAAAEDAKASLNSRVHESMHRQSPGHELLQHCRQTWPKGGWMKGVIRGISDWCALCWPSAEAQLGHGVTLGVLMWRRNASLSDGCEVQRFGNVSALLEKFCSGMQSMARG